MFRFFKWLFSPVIAVLDFITKYFKTIVFLTIIYFIFFNNTDNLNENSNSLVNLEKIDLYGPIVEVSKTLEEINRAKINDNVKGVLLDVNSPGGGVAPSIELSIAIKELAQIKPVVVYTSGIMASGGYYASIWANKIVANPGSMVGSIGVIIQGVNLEELMEKIGISSQIVKAGKYKESGTLYRRWTEYEEKQLQSVIDDTYNMFVNDVANARSLDVNNKEKFADAKVFTASQAKDVGLVDEVATLSHAQNLLAQLANVEEPMWRKKDKFEMFMDRFISESISRISVVFSQSLKAY